ncbi:MAG: hypothetical protein GF308_02785 [Candidatus Heimdallarchaeota archaeon]|nr:hypothetical protein [Candidatus Heimdallarchaeota archaeon]
MNNSTKTILILVIISSLISLTLLPSINLSSIDLSVWCYTITSRKNQSSAIDNQMDHYYQYLPVIYPRNNNDSDEDGLPDVWEEENGCDPTIDDSTLDYDYDELTNIEEYELNCDPLNPDTDGDRFNDGFEVEKGTDPTDPNDHPVRIWLIILIVIFSALLLFALVWITRIMIQVAREEKSKNKES